MTTEKIVTYEELNTYLKIVQRNLNSKPRLMKSTRNRNNLNLITPNEMLLGRKITNLNFAPHRMCPKLVRDPVIQEAYEDREKYLQDLQDKMFTINRADENLRDKWQSERDPYPIGSLVQYNPKIKHKARPNQFPKALINDHVSTRSSVIRNYDLDFGANNTNPLLRNRKNRIQQKRHDDIKLIYTAEQLKNKK